MLKRIQISPERYAQVTLIALVALVLIVFTGSAPELIGNEQVLASYLGT